MFDGFYATTKSVCLLLSATASVVAGFRIFIRWNRGDEVEAPLMAWAAGGISAALLVFMVDNFIFRGGYDGSAIDWEAKKLSNGVYTLCISLGCLVAILGIYHLYEKSQNGDDDLPLYLWKWGASILFFFSMAGIINAIY